MMEYKIVSDWAIKGFEKEVQHHLEDGWRLAGNLVVVYDPGDRPQVLFYQAMTRGAAESPESFG